MTQQLVEILSRAVKSSEILSVKYHGGSQPGAKRQISPISIDGPKVRARCLTSNAVKVFVIEKIELCDGKADPAKVWDPDKKTFPKYRTLEDVYSGLRPSLEDMGWHVQFDNDRITLHRIRKNGTPLKGPDAILSYTEWKYDEYFDGEQHVQENKRKHPRPYGVGGKGRSGGMFSDIDRAVERFLADASEFSPNKGES